MWTSVSPCIWGTGGVRDEAAVFAAEQGVDLAPRTQIS
jgi:hypothetical protein